MPKEQGHKVATPGPPTPPGLPTVPMAIIPPPPFLEDFHLHRASPVWSLSEQKVPYDSVGGTPLVPHFGRGGHRDREEAITSNMSPCFWQKV